MGLVGTWVCYLDVHGQPTGDEYDHDNFKEAESITLYDVQVLKVVDLGFADFVVGMLGAPWIVAYRGGGLHAPPKNPPPSNTILPLARSGV